MMFDWAGLGLIAVVTALAMWMAYNYDISSKTEKE